MKSETKLKFKETSFDAIGTKWTIAYEPSASSHGQLLKSILGRIEVYDRTYSRFRDDSLVNRIAAKAGNYNLPSDSIALFEAYRTLYDITDGAVSPLVGQTLSDAGYDKNYSLQYKRTTVAKDWDDVISYKDQKLEAKMPVLLDFGAAGKGQLIDIVAELLEAELIQHYVITAGGDIRVNTDASIEVALQHPIEPDLAIGIAALNNRSICGSSIHLRKWGAHHHIINPKDGVSPKHIHAVWVVADQAMVSDALATALFFVDPKKLQERFNFEYVIVHEDFSVEYSSNFPGRIFDGSEE